MSSDDKPADFVWVDNLKSAIILANDMFAKADYLVYIGKRGVKENTRFAITTHAPASRPWVKEKLEFVLVVNKVNNDYTE